MKLWSGSEENRNVILEHRDGVEGSEVVLVIMMSGISLKERLMSAHSFKGFTPRTVA